MNNKIKEIKSFICGCMDGEGRIEDIKGVISYVNTEFNTNIILKEVGWIEDDDFYIRTYAWAGIIDDELYFDTLWEDNIPD